MLQISHISPKIRETIHEKSLHILMKTGVAFDYEPALRLLKKHGARIDGKTAYIPANLIQECLATCPASFSLEARNSAKSILVGGILNLSGLPRPGGFRMINTIFIPLGAGMLLVSIGLSMQFKRVKDYLKKCLVVAGIKFLIVPLAIGGMAYLKGIIP